MRRFRVRSALLGIVVLLVNASLVVAIVSVAGQRASDGIELPPSSKHQTTPKARQSTVTQGPSPSSAVVTASKSLATANRAITIAVLGDGTGDEDGEWVQVLARMLGETRRVSLRTLDSSDPTRYAGAEKFGTDGPATTVWNGSRRGVTADYAAPRLDFLVPGKPDVVVLNYGRDNTATNVDAQLSATHDAIRARWPTAAILVTLQAQDRDDVIGPVRAVTDDWARTHGVATIDVAGAFAAAGDPNRFVSVVDPPSVNSKGGRLWARTVLAALGGDVSRYPADGAMPDSWDAGGPTGPTGTRTTSPG